MRTLNFWYSYLFASNWSRSVDCVLSMSGKIMTPMSRLWLHGSYGFWWWREKLLNLTHWRWEILMKFCKINFKVILISDGWGISCEIALRWLSLDLTDDKSTLIQVPDLCRHILSPGHNELIYSSLTCSCLSILYYYTWLSDNRLHYLTIMQPVHLYL